MKIEFFQPEAGYFRYAAAVGTTYVYARSKREMRRKIRSILKAAANTADLEKEFSNR